MDGAKSSRRQLKLHAFQCNKLIYREEIKIIIRIERSEGVSRVRKKDQEVC